MRLAHRVLGDPDAARELWLLHGILGSGNNWRGLALRLIERQPGLRVVLIDLRNHGDSLGAPPPHTVARAAEDLFELAAERGRLPHGLAGHSFGGKVALAFAAQAGALGGTGAQGLSRLWVLDASPAAWPGAAREDAEVLAVIDALRALPLPIPSREQLARALVERGFSRSLALWMTTNLRREGEGYLWRFDLDAAAEMIEDYFRLDLWPVVEEPPEGLWIELVIAGRNPRWTREERTRLQALADQGLIGLHTIEEAGHWLHVDAPEAVLARLLA